MKKVLFLDRDGTLIEEPIDEQIDNFNKLKFVPGVISALSTITQKTDYELVMVSNQDGLGSNSFPECDFAPIQDFILETFRGEGILFTDIIIDRHFPEDHSPERKPGTALLKKYMSREYDLSTSIVIGDRETDMQLAENLGCLGIQIGRCGLDWDKISKIVLAGERSGEIHRVTKETDVYVKVDLDRKGVCEISTGLHFFDHMLEQIAFHGSISLTVQTHGDLFVDEHHTIEDTGIALGLCLRQCLGNKIGIRRYGFCLPMDDSLSQVALDFGGRPWLEWNVNFTREMIGDVPTEMFFHFFKSLSDSAAMNLNIQASGKNEHHKIEAVFKAFSHALKAGIARDVNCLLPPSSKGIL